MTKDDVRVVIVNAVDAGPHAAREGTSRLTRWGAVAGIAVAAIAFLAYLNDLGYLGALKAGTPAGALLQMRPVQSATVGLSIDVEADTDAPAWAHYFFVRDSSGVNRIQDHPVAVTGTLVSGRVTLGTAAAGGCEVFAIGVLRTRTALTSPSLPPDAVYSSNVIRVRRSCH
jgi:hypothetical protein